MEKVASHWKLVNIAEEQIELIKKLIENSKIKAKYGFKSVPEAIRRAISDFIEKLKKELEEV